MRGELLWQPPSVLLFLCSPRGCRARVAVPSLPRARKGRLCERRGSIRWLLSWRGTGGQKWEQPLAFMSFQRSQRLWGCAISIVPGPLWGL